MSPREKHRIIQLSENYMWHDDCLYRTGHNLVIRRFVQEDDISNPSMMAYVEAIFLIRGKHTKYYSQATIGQLFLRMQRSMWPAVKIVRGWGNQL
jgi:hypothetical protein